LITDRLREFFQRGGDQPLSSGHRAQIPGSLSKHAKKTGLSEARASRGLEQFFFNIRDTVGLTILDLAVPNQENITFLTSLGHKLYTADLIGCLDDAFGKNPADQTNAGRIEYFLRSSLDYPPDTFDAVLLWDGLQFMGPALLTATVDRLFEIMRPDAYLLAFVTANERVTEVPAHTFRIIDNKNITIIERGTRASGQVFNNRNIEKLFQRFQSVKFFLTKESLREVIVRR
jgi:hypothetical protein